ncbi:uncharacterized protein TRAVEDRAFT_45080 [Trametes versicolor FP-101664 SS1]|uniref:uncharacterized protein n=1 Tax=Trametes versicolor (strain FP-101664) TaxID=717944 RepID=UPI0004623192|nr:uncharacterized protein TRAVEDRAFT_45080 [Trametes versicolor FP-101664 SS1]EIW62249.1 hypothetical protein TRAVEDRAFT_45080 [Trametes versicolor FP-101664 SS1]
MSPTQSTDGYTRSLSHAVFSRMDPGRPVLRLLDPATNELCDYRLVKIPRRTTTSPVPTRPTRDQPGLGRCLGETLGSETPDLGYVNQSSHSSGGSRDCASELWHGPPSFGARFNSPLARLPPFSVRSRGDGTPSLFNDSRNSDGSSPSLGPTPIRKLFPGAARTRLDTPAESPWVTGGSTAFAGLGFSELRKDDGTPFDGLGSLPRHTSTPQYSYASPTGVADQSSDSHPINYLHFVRSRTTTTPAAGGALSPPLAPARHSGGGRAQSVAGTRPVRPDQDDVFLSRPIRVPGSLARGLFRRSSSSCGTKGARRASVAGTPSVARRSSWSWMTDRIETGSTRGGGERKPVWKP